MDNNKFEGMSDEEIENEVADELDGFDLSNVDEIIEESATNGKSGDSIKQKPTKD